MCVHDRLVGRTLNALAVLKCVPRPIVRHDIHDRDGMGRLVGGR